MRLTLRITNDEPRGVRLLTGVGGVVQVQSDFDPAEILDRPDEFDAVIFDVPRERLSLAQLEAVNVALKGAETSDVPFGQAIEHLKAGGRAARAGWNGKDMFVFLNKGSVSSEALEADGSVVLNSEADARVLIGGVEHLLFDRGDEGTVTRMPNLNMRAADGSTVTGWLASQTDILAEDWVLL